MDYKIKASMIMAIKSNNSRSDEMHTMRHVLLFNLANLIKLK